MNLQEKREIRKAAMFALIDQQLASGLSQLQFCQQQQISIATFGYWRQKYLIEKTLLYRTRMLLRNKLYISELFTPLFRSIHPCVENCDLKLKIEKNIDCAK